MTALSRPNFWFGSILLCLLASSGVLQAQPEIPLPKRGDNGENGLPKLPQAEEDLEEETTTPLRPGLYLRQALEFGLSNSPNIAAAQFSLQSSEISYQAILNPSFLARLLARDLDFRKQQALRGLAAAQARVAEARSEVIYEVSRSYYTLMYAQAQKKVADRAVEQGQSFRDLVRDIVESAGNEDLNNNTVDVLTSYVYQAQIRQAEAIAGIERAKAALREAMNVDPEYPIELPTDELPMVPVAITKDQVIQLAFAQRPELIQTAVATDLFRLEVCAQGAIRLTAQARTFAAGADLHASAVPGPQRGAEYRPAALGLEMPIGMFGRPDERQAKAAALSKRTDMVYQKTRNLIRLEAESVYHRWLAAAEAVEKAQEADELIDGLQERLELKGQAGKAPPNTRQRVRELLEYRLVIAQNRVQTNEVLYQHLLTLVDLERITAGGIIPPFPGR